MQHNTKSCLIQSKIIHDTKQHHLIQHKIILNTKEYYTNEVPVSNSLATGTLFYGYTHRNYFLE